MPAPTKHTPSAARLALFAALAGVAASALAQTCDPAALFAAPLSYPAPAAVAGNIALADFNGDGVQDLVVEDDTGVGFVSVLLGDGAGGYGPAAQFATNQARPHGLSVGDVNRDGHLDIVCGNELGSNVVLLLGLGDGTFRTASTITTAIAQSRETALADFNGDGRLDLVVSDINNARLWLLLGNGDGTFRSGTAIPAGGTPSYFTVADADGDGHLDLIVGNGGGGDVSVIRGDGAGRFADQRRFAAGSGPQRPAVADVNGDGILDIVVANFSSNTVSVLLGIDGLAYAPGVHTAVGSSPRHARVADFTGDGVADIIVTNRDSNDVSLLVGVGDGTFEPQRRFAVHSQPVDGAALDANRDGAIDLVVVHRGSQDVAPLLNTCVPDLAFTTQPKDAIATIGGVARFEAAARGPEPLAYQWLFQGRPIRGANGPSLVVQPVQTGDMGYYSLRLTARGEQLFSEPARLAVFNPCPGDFDGDGQLTIFDFLAFQNAFAAGCP